MSAGMQPLRDPVKEQVRQADVAKITRGELLVLLPQRLRHLGDRRARQKRAALSGRSCFRSPA